MPAPFEGLEDRLLRGGIAPRHVKRYLRELTEHLADLAEAQAAAGFDPADATARARAALGPDAELADAMLKQRDFRSISARFPWLVFGVLPPLALLLGFALILMAMMLVGVTSGAFIPDHRGPLPVPAWYDWTARGTMFAANFLLESLLAFLLAWLAQRQRMKPIWPLLGMGLILLLNLHGEFQPGTKRLFVHLGTLIPFYPAKGPFGPWGEISWTALLGQAALFSLPVFWLLHTRRKTGMEA